MEKGINTLHIENFKSIRSAVLHPRRVNLIIGQPNVGKSNLMEAMSLLGSRTYDQNKRFMGDFLRYEKPQQLFHDNMVAQPVRISTDRDVCVLAKKPEGKGFHFGNFSLATHKALAAQLAPAPGANGRATPPGADGTLLANLPGLLAQLPDGATHEFRYTELDHHGQVQAPAAPGQQPDRGWKPTAVKPYRFHRKQYLAQHPQDTFLYPPYGDNLVHVLESHTKLRHEFAGLFASHGLQLRVRVDAQRFEVVKDLDGLSYSYPYSSSGDTLQRYAFYLAAMGSNNHSTILFEEPETHSYPMYVAQLGQRIAVDSANQYFVTTHSPYLFREVLDNMVPYEKREPELAVFVAYYQDYETKFRQLSDDEVRNIRRDCVDVFYNMDKFVQSTTSQSEQALRNKQLAAIRRPVAHALTP